MLINMYLFRDIRVSFRMGSHSYPKVIVEGLFQACNDDCQSFVRRSDRPRAIQWEMLAFIVDVIPIWRKILRLLWNLQFNQN